MALEQGDAGLFQHLAEDGFGDLGFGHPGEFLMMAVEAVVAAGAKIEFEGESADHFPLPYIRAGESAADESADMVARLQQDGFEPLARARNGGCNAGGATAVNNKIVALLRKGRRGS